MIQIGRVCVKLAGRDAGKKCAIIEILDEHFVMIDGETRRRKCNILHLEPLPDTVSIQKGAAHAQVCKALGIETTDTKRKQAASRPKKQRKQKEEKPKPEVVRKSKKIIEKMKTAEPAAKPESKPVKSADSSTKAAPGPSKKKEQKPMAAE